MIDPVDAGTTDDALLYAAAAGSAPPRAVEPLLADGGADRRITARELHDHVDALVHDQVTSSGARRVLLVPPDHTRLHSRAGEITASLFTTLTAAGCDVGVLPALGTHAAMTPPDALLMFGPSVPHDKLLHHDWRHGLRALGEIDAAEIASITDGRYADGVPIAVDDQLFDGWDLVISIGQVLPHEVIGMANFTKNIVIGLGGAPTIHRSHFIGAICDMERIMGRASTPVRRVVDAAFDRYVDPLVPVLFVLTVMEDEPGAVVQRGLFAGRGGTASSGGAAYRAAAELSARTNIDVLPRALDRVACWLDPAELRSTWLGNKAIYRTRMAIADGGELVVLAPGVHRFGEDAHIDALIRRHGYRGTAAALAAVHDDPDLATNLGAAAHLVHGSTEGRFRVVYCTDETIGGLSRRDIEAVGYEWRPLADELQRLGVDGSTPTGRRDDADGRPFEHIANPSLGLWAASSRWA